MDDSHEEPLPKVAIIGAGVSGLLSAKHLKDVAEIKVFESRDQIGGIWHYSALSERTTTDKESDAYYKLYGNLHSSLYNNLTTNVPKNCMTFKDFCHDKDTPYIMPSGSYHDYLISYAEKFELNQFVSLNTTVTSLEINVDSERKYCIRSVPTDQK